MNPEEPYRDQAERLKRRIEKINEKTENGERLPPRGQLHRQKPKKTKMKLKYPVIRLLVLLFILLPVTCFSIISYYHGKKINGVHKVLENQSGYESIKLETSKQGKETDTDISKSKEQEIKKDSSNTTPASDDNKTVPAVSQPQEKSEEAEKPVQNTTVDRQTSQNEIEKNKNEQPKTAASAEKSRIIYHTVQPKETLFRIAMNYYHSKSGINIIRDANHLFNDQIYTGQVLKIPLNN
ncbi:LysM peptidoglycan-binding domain-containing protein [Neobacillus niacini]|uniref:LysM peptidoglycan-binding domain-containing protein n=1 Tax=Neobacillus niacini TaxID=86668 RepID=UPI002865D5C9|nr:LysM peptidoglycan-binding domain-containing protein [Neobacillus niacini]MDR6998582.1 cytoskeletal protein RodZ [Neobacillus niacini]